MNRRFLAISALIATIFMLTGLLLLDRPLAQWIHGSDLANATVFVRGLDILDTLAGIHVSYWLASAVFVCSGLVLLALSYATPLPRAFAAVIVLAGLIQATTIGLMMLGKNTFGRMRPSQVLESGDWSTIWFVGGGSFPSGHSSFYFGLLLPLAAAAPRAWQRMALMLIPVFAICARLDMGRHFLSDVAASALIAAGTALLFATILKRWSAGPLAPERRSPP